MAKNDHDLKQITWPDLIRFGYQILKQISIFYNNCFNQIICQSLKYRLQGYQKDLQWEGPTFKFLFIFGHIKTKKKYLVLSSQQGKMKRKTRNFCHIGS